MDRNSIAHFSDAPSVAMERSTFLIFDDHHTSFDAGKLYPILFKEIYPGDTFSLDMAATVRMATPKFPVMDNCYVDTYFFYCPTRLTWSSFKAFMGDSNVSAYESDGSDLQIPQLKAPSSGFKSGSIADHFGIPVNICFDDYNEPDNPLTISELPFRAVRLIWNRWFRNQNVEDPLLVNLGNNQSQGNIGNEEPYPVNRFRDYFSSCLPAPQKGAAVQLPLSGSAPVLTYNDFLDGGLGELTPEQLKFAKILSSTPNLRWFSRTASDSDRATLMVDPVGYIRDPVQQVDEGMILETSNGESVNNIGGIDLRPANLQARFDLGTGYSTINALRQAFAIQRILEKDARSGSRYVEILRSHFNVIAPDSSLQEPEYLGGFHQMLNMDQVLQTSYDNESPIGHTGAFSKTNMHGSVFTKSFTEHGMLLGFCCIRTDRSYQQGVHKSFLRKSRYDFYWPSLAHISEQPVKLVELYANMSDGFSKDEIFGYQEAWADLRVGNSNITGAFRSNYQDPVGNVLQGYNAWHYADYYGSRPYLSAQWMHEGDVNVARTLAGYDPDSINKPLDTQFLADFYFQTKASRCMPLYSIPGLIDHF